MDLEMGTREYSGIDWPTVGHPGRVPLDALVPDPNQPRKYFDNDELDALAKTMNPKNGGEQREILTARILTAEEIATLYPPPARYMIVSGERRWRAAPRAGWKDIEIRVKAYKSRAYQKLDAYMLNNGRVGLSDIENALYIADLAKDFGWTTQEEIARNIGESQNWVSQRLALLKLSSRVQALMAPDIKEHLRLNIGTAVVLSRLSLPVQDDFAERMPKGSRVTVGQQIRWIKEELATTGVMLPSRKQKPGTVRRIISSYAGFVELRAAQILKNEDLGHLFENVTLVEAQDLLGKMKDAQYELGEVVRRMEALLEKIEGPAKPRVVDASQAKGRSPEETSHPEPRRAAPQANVAPHPAAGSKTGSSGGRDGFQAPARPIPAAPAASPERPA